jgi:hypothetical protein
VRGNDEERGAGCVVLKGDPVRSLDEAFGGTASKLPRPFTFVAAIGDASGEAKGLEAAERLPRDDRLAIGDVVDAESGDIVAKAAPEQPTVGGTEK